jgi:membrane-bound metal-dependent hydrolase YbcI (DUF457 family)
MDLFSHALLGFVLGQALLLDTNAQIILIISSIILDIDGISIPGWKAWPKFHHACIHSILGAILASLVISTASTVLMFLPAKSFTSIFLICLGGSFCHILLDILTTGSMAVGWPLSNKRVAFDLTRFVDPIFLAVLLVASVFIVYAKNNVRMIQTATILTIALLTLNFVVRYYERAAAIKIAKGLNVEADSKVVSLPTLRLDRWWVVMKTKLEKGDNYEIYSVDPIRNKILSHRTVKSPFINCREIAELPLDSPQKAVAFSKRDKRVNAFIEQSRLPAVTVTLSDDGGTWQVFWYDVFTQLSGGVSRGITIKVKID